MDLDTAALEFIGMLLKRLLYSNFLLTILLAGNFIIRRKLYTMAKIDIPAHENYKFSTDSCGGIILSSSNLFVDDRLHANHSDHKPDNKPTFSQRYISLKEHSNKVISRFKIESIIRHAAQAETVLRLAEPLKFHSQKPIRGAELQMIAAGEVFMDTANRSSADSS